MNKGHLYILAGILSAVGVLLFLYKAFVLDFPFLPSDMVERWDLEARLRFVANGGPAKATLSIPSSTRRALLVDERFVSRGFGLNMEQSESGRRVVWSRRQAQGEQVLYYRATLQFPMTSARRHRVKKPPRSCYPTSPDPNWQPPRPCLMRCAPNRRTPRPWSCN